MRQYKNRAEVVTFAGKDRWLKENGLDGKFYFDGGDLVEAETGESAIRLGRGGTQSDFLKKQIEFHYPGTIKNKKAR